ncbi:MAG TPA: tail fiber domain-containing protein [Thermoanaerobaculia bacterium]|nr:tail fiber domain-containing protein [Thermoanaerobaculia bacterium]
MVRTTSLLFSFFVATSVTAAVITAAAAGQRVRFASPSPTAQIRVQILFPSGDVLFDSEWKDGNVFDWPADSLADGAYRCVVMVRDLEGNVAQKESAITAQSGKVSVEDRAAPEPKVTLLAHDGANGEIVSTSGDLKFSFGDFLAGREKERMRLTAEGDLHIEGTIRATRGIVLPDGTVVASAEAVAARAPQLRPSSRQPTASSARLTPRPNFTPGYQFVVNETGVMVGTTNPAFRLDVTGEINTATQYDIGGTRFMHNFGTLNTFVGSGAGNLTMSGTTNAAFGGGVLQANTNGTSNTGAGQSALFNNTTGYDNTAVGTSALYSNVGGTDNTAIGRLALFNNTIGLYNTAGGASALQSNVGGGSNTAFGYNALMNSNAHSNTAVGYQALLNTTTGTLNIALGNSAGSAITTGIENIDIGNGGTNSDTETIRIGVTQTRAFMAGIRFVTTGNADAIPVYIDSAGQLGNASSSRRFKFDINDMSSVTDGLMQLRPVTFRYLAHGHNAALQYGLIAEEVAEVYPELVVRDKDGQPDAIMAQFLAPMLLNEVQKQHRKIEEQQNTIDALTRRLEAVESRLAKE